MKKFSSLYFILLLAFFPVLDRMLAIGTRISPWFLLLLPGYVSWFIFSPILFYSRNKKKQMKEGFVCHAACNGAYTTFWLDKNRGELAVLCLFNPFKVQYISVNRIGDASAGIKNLSKDQKTADQINLILTVDGKRQKTVVLMSSRYYIIHMDGDGNKTFDETKRFAEQILEAKQFMEQKDVIVVRNY